MLSKSKIKLIRSLEKKKERKETGLFVAEGPKVVGDLLEAGFQPRLLIATEEWATQNAQAISSCEEFCNITDEELRKVSFLQHPQQVLAIFYMPEHPLPLLQGKESPAVLKGEEGELLKRELVLALDGVQDPGNLGTIIRIADWFGITHIFCSTDTADAYNPKVVQATMGSLARVKIVFTDLPQLIDALPHDIPIYGTMLDGDDIYSQPLQPHGLLIMGNEGNGLSHDVARRVNRRLFIPNFPPGRETADSLNVAVATAVACAEFRRQQGGRKN